MSASGSHEESRPSGWLRSMVQRTFASPVKAEQISSSSSSEQEANEERDPEVKQSPSSPEGERCVVCTEAIRGSARARCPGCARRVHKEGCSTYMVIAKRYEVGVCNICCAKVTGVFDKVREFVANAGMEWDEDKWLKKLIKS